ncbi:hypothetical protein GLAREA_00682 [Glarea lozoyensis ATCC 20868]|uniref:SP-RING-type domain-containing protein n=1 Tax=Glarea lozoyensis (strain ATCC 20868 / MF5171) TaxID=1116229 RepID=S3CSW1_GLAL2|nr:uncharacterized protein GLAREA_00682 [Glarea lozoyensis ATCC 20868]EPE29522.1 hypothetical protein GLAREA_00682 [Glarea lozoyensis ATCC 20868]
MDDGITQPSPAYAASDQKRSATSAHSEVSIPLTPDNGRTALPWLCTNCCCSNVVLPSPAPSDEPNSPILANSPNAYGEASREGEVAGRAPAVPVSMNRLGHDLSNASIGSDGPDICTRSVGAGVSGLTSASNDPHTTNERLSAARDMPSTVSPQPLDASSLGHIAQPLPPDTRLETSRVQPPILLHDEVRSPRQPPSSSLSGATSPMVISDAAGNHLREQLQASVASYDVHMPTTLPLPSSMIQHPQQQSYPSPISTSAPPNKRQRTYVPVMPTMKPRIQMIDNQLRNLHANPGYDHHNMLEIPRYNLLKEACLGEDAFYIALHQVFCVWDLPDTNQIATIPDFPSSAVLLRSFKIMAQLIRDNGSLAEAHKIWFAGFPSPLRILLRSSAPYRKMVQDVGKFLAKLATEWEKLQVECKVRKYPPLVDEMVGRLALLSPTLQQVVFTAIRRNLGIIDDSWGQRMEDLFKRDRKEHQALSARYNSGRPPTQREIDERNIGLVNEYLVVYKALLHARNQTNSNPASPVTRLPTPILPSNAAAASVAQSNVQRNNSTIPRISTQRRTSSMMSGQHPGVARAPTMSSPSMPSPLAVGLNGGSTGQQPYRGNPSPTAMRPASAQSPHHMYPDAGFQYFQGANGSPYPIPTQNSGQLNMAQSPVQGLPSQHLLQQNQWLQQHPQSPQLQQHRQIPQFQQSMPFAQNMQQQPVQLYGQHAANPQSRRNSSIPTNFRPSANLRNVGQPPTGGNPPRNVNTAHQWQNGLNIEEITRTVLAHMPQTANQNQPIQQPARPQMPIDGSRPLLPDRNSVVPQHIVDPDKTALHQAHLRSPRLVVHTVPRVDKPQNDPNFRCYQVVKSLAFGPSKLRTDGPLTKFDFQLSGEDVSRIPKDTFLPDTSRVGTRILKHGALQYRFRCIQTRPEVTRCLMPDWVVSETIWPQNSFVAINRQPLELRRKFHHGKDLPIDISQKLLSSNLHSSYQISVSIPKWRSPDLAAYLCAVEVIELLQHRQILDMIRHQRIPAESTLESIKKVLSPTGNDDDDIAMVVSDLSLDLTDPFTAKIFETPVRSKQCLHRECFDLETFLQTRNSKPKRPQQPCMPDVWKCPLCGKDSRPYELQIDGFLVEVRTELASKNDLDVKAILIAPDGTWRPKRESSSKRKATRDPYDDESSEDDDFVTPVSGSTAKAPASRVIEIIDLDDD